MVDESSGSTAILRVVSQERVVRVSVRTVLTVIGLVIAAWALLTYEAETAPP